MSSRAVIGGLFVGMGVMTLALYALLLRGGARVNSAQQWGYMRGFSWLWVSGTTVTVSAVLGLYGWILFGGGEPITTAEERLAVAGTATFLAGAIVWPTGILSGSMWLARVGVAAAAAGTIVLCVYTFTRDAPPAAEAAAIWVVLHHCVVDGLWAVLPVPPPPTALQFI